MAYTTRSNFKHNHYFACCKTAFKEGRGYRSKSANPPSSLMSLYSAPISGINTRHVPPFSIQSQQRNTVVVSGPASERGKKKSKLWMVILKK